MHAPLVSCLKGKNSDALRPFCVTGYRTGVTEGHVWEATEPRPQGTLSMVPFFPSQSVSIRKLHAPSTMGSSLFHQPPSDYLPSMLSLSCRSFQMTIPWHISKNNFAVSSAIDRTAQLLIPVRQFTFSYARTHKLSLIAMRLHVLSLGAFSPMFFFSFLGLAWAMTSFKVFGQNQTRREF